MSFIQQTALYGWMRRAECHGWWGGAVESPHWCVSSDGGKEGAGDAGLSRREMPELPGPGSPANACLFLPLRPLRAPCRG